MSSEKKIISLFLMTPEEKNTLLKKQNHETSVEETTNKQDKSVFPPTVVDFNKDQVYESSLHSNASGKAKSIKRIMFFVAIICAMLVGAGIAVSMMSSKNTPAAGVSAVSEQNEAFLQQFGESDSSHTRKTSVKTTPTAHHDSYYYADGLLTIKSDEYYESDYKEYMELADLKRVTIESGVTAIGSKSFAGCSNLSSIEIPDTVTYIGESAFEDCKSLTSISLPANLQAIEGWAFSGCTSLKNIQIPENISWIGNLAFAKCSALETVSVDENNRYFSSEDGVLFNKDKTILYKYPPAKSNASYVIPDGVKYIDDHSFCVCNNLLSVTIPEGVLSIGNRSFSNCKNLTSVNIPSSMKHIGVWAFSNNSQINTISIPYEVTDIDHSAFNKWTSSQKIIITGRETPPDTWHDNWNANCNANVIWEK